MLFIVEIVPAAEPEEHEDEGFRDEGNKLEEESESRHEYPVEIFPFVERL